MPLLAFCLRQVRRKAVLGLALGLALLLLLAHGLPGSGLFTADQESNILRLRKLNQPFNWNEAEDAVPEPGNGSLVELATCRNSVQGRETIVDDRGFVCPRTVLLSTGCCDANSTLSGRHQCASCDSAAACCRHYEDCVSCCLRPEQRPGLQQILTRAAQSDDVLFVSVSDHFELCLAKCRTSSSSVQHENTYRNKLKKFCYGQNPPPTVDSSEKP